MKEKRLNVLTSQVVAEPDHTEIERHFSFFVARPVRKTEDDGGISYHECCARLKAAGGEVLAMYMTRGADGEAFHIMTRRGAPLMIVEGFLVDPRASHMIPKHALLNLWWRHHMAEREGLVGAVAEDGRPYLIHKRSDRIGLIHAHSVSFVAGRRGGPEEGQIFLRVSAHAFKRLDGDRASPENTEDLIARILAGRPYADDDAAKRERAPRRLFFSDRGALRPLTKAAAHVPREEIYEMGNRGGHRITMDAFNVSSGAQFEASKSGAIVRAISVMNAPETPGMRLRLARAEIRRIGFSSGRMRAKAEDQTALAAMVFPRVLIHDAVRTRDTARALAELRRILPRSEILMTEKPGDADILLVFSEERFSKLGDLAGEVDVYGLKKPFSQAVTADAYKFGKKDKSGTLAAEETENVLGVLLNEMVIKKEVRDGRLLFQGATEFAPFRAASLIRKGDHRGEYVVGHYEAGRIRFEIMDGWDHKLAYGFTPPQGDCVTLGRDTVELTRGEFLIALPDVHAAASALDRAFDGGDVNNRVIPPTAVLRALRRAGITGLDQEFVENASRKELAQRFPVRTGTADQKERNAAFRAALAEEGYDLAIRGARAADTVAPLTGILISTEGDFYCAGAIDGVKERVARFAGTTHTTLWDGEDIPDAFYDLLLWHNPHHKRINSRPFLFKHMREFLLTQE